MNANSIGMIEFSSIASGFESADAMVKAAEVEPIFFKTICPGKFIAAVRGDVAAVTASIDAGKAMTQHLVDSFIIPNIHEDVLSALAGASLANEEQSLGIIETYSAVSIILASDAAAKAADVRLLDIRLAMGLGGKGYALLSGNVGSVNAAVEAGSYVAAQSGLLVSKVVIPGPAAALWQHIF